MQSEYDQIGGKAGSHGGGDGRYHDAEGTVCRSLSGSVQDKIDGDTGEDITDRRKRPHTPGHSEKERKNTLNAAHNRSTAEGGNNRRGNNKKHQRKTGGNPAGNMQGFRDDICRRRYEFFRKQTKITAQSHEDKGSKIKSSHYAAPFQ